MKFRSQLLVGFLLGALVPMIALAIVVRHEMSARLTAQSEARVETLLRVIEGAIVRRGDEVHASLAQVQHAIAADNRFRRAAVDDSESDRRFLLDYAGNAMRLSGLAMLQIQDEHGRIVSSGQFRNDYDRLEPELPRFLGSLSGRVALVRARTPAEPLLVLASIDTVTVGRSWFTLCGGIEATVLDELTRGSRLTVTLSLPGDSIAVDSTRGIVRRLPIPCFDTETHTYRMAALRVTSDLSELRELQRSVDRWFLIAVGLAALSIILLAIGIAARISRPVVDLAQQTAQLDLDRLDVDFDTDRSDELGSLAKGLQTMTSRLRESTVRLKDAERRATLGDVARQVNHDIKNGLTPIRNAFRHLTQHVDDAGQLQSALRERQTGMIESIGYLESLATNYAKLSQRGVRQHCDVNDIAKKVADGVRGLANVTTRLQRGAVVDADPLALRRILENLVDNAIDSLGGPEGSVTLETQVAKDTGRVRVIVSDNGTGMNDAQRVHIFDDFYTTKPDGSGLGLSIVRRLVMDMEGTVNVESAQGKGSRFSVDLPASKGGD